MRLFVCIASALIFFIHPLVVLALARAAPQHGLKPALQTRWLTNPVDAWAEAKKLKKPIFAVFT